MARPEFPNGILTPNVIRSVRERQDVYDRDPEAYERRERDRQQQAVDAEAEMYGDENPYDPLTGWK